MKKYLSISVLSILLLSFIIYSCSDNNDDFNNNETSMNEVIFEDLSLKTNVSPNFYDNHFYLIEKLGKNEERSEIINIAIQNGIEKSQIIERDIKKLFLNNSEIIMYSLQLKELDKSLIIYKYDDIYQVSIASFYDIDNGIKQFKITTIDETPFYSIKINKENKMGDFILNTNSQMNEFSNQVYTKHLQKHKIEFNNSSAKSAGCCRNESSWSGCMNCTVSACGTSWVCAGAFGIAPREMLAAFAVSCVGAGPNTFC